MAQTCPPKAQNGGFPEPPENSAVRLIAARHDACGETTRVRLMAAIRAASVRRMHCAQCATDFEPALVEDLGTVTSELATAAREIAIAVAEITGSKRSRRIPVPRITVPRVSIPRLDAARAAARRVSVPKPGLSLPRPSLPRINPDGRFWQLASIPLAAIAVVGTLALLQGDDDGAPSVAVQSATLETAAPETAERVGDGPVDGGKTSKNTELVRGSSYSLALPAGWSRVPSAGGATFAAVAPDGEADATLWIDEDPELDFPNFVSQSLAQLEALTGSARVVERFPAPTPEATVVRLAADSPADQPSYEVTLRVAGAFRYYLATSVQPDAAPEAAEGVELVVGSFTPELEG